MVESLFHPQEIILSYSRAKILQSLHTIKYKSFCQNTLILYSCQSLRNYFKVTCTMLSHKQGQRYKFILICTTNTFCTKICKWQKKENNCVSDFHYHTCNFSAMWKRLLTMLPNSIGYVRNTVRILQSL
jgi:hypothetical protein